MKTKRRGRPKGYKFKNELLPKIYELAKSGMSNEAISRALGFDKYTLTKWSRAIPEVKVMLEEGRKFHGQELSEGLRGFVYGRLSPRAKTLWNKLVELEDAGDEEGALMHLASAGKRLRQQIFYHALVHFDFNSTMACQFVNIDSTTYRTWMKDDPEFRELLNAIHMNKGDFFESALIKLVRGGDTAATLFANRTFNRDRGYNEKVDMNVTGEVEHKFSFDDLNLPLETKIQILEAMRKKEQPKLEDHSNVVEAEFEEVPDGVASTK